MTTFGKQLRYLRKRANLTQQDLGKIISVSASTIGMYERGTREPSFKTLIEIADYFHVSTDYLLGHSSNENIANCAASFLSENDEKILHLQQEHPKLFNYLTAATTSELKMFFQLLKIIREN